MRVRDELLVVFAHEYRAQVLRKGLLVLYGMVLVAAALFPFVYGVAVGVRDNIRQGLVAEYGYVDLVGVVPEQEDGPKRFATVDEGLSAIGSGEVAILFVLPADFETTGTVKDFRGGDAGGMVDRLLAQANHTRFVDFLQASVGADLGLSPVVQRIYGLDPTSDILISQAENLGFDEEAQQSDGLRGVVTIVLGFCFMLAVSAFGAVLPQRLIEDKADGMADLLLSSVSAVALVCGKLAGCVAAALSHGALWYATLFGAVSVLGLTPDYGIIDPTILAGLVLGVLLYLSLYMLVATIANSFEVLIFISFPVTLVSHFSIPAMVLFASPDWIGLKILTYVPLTAPAMLVVRRGLGHEIPAAESAAALALTGAAIVGAVWLAGQVYRAGARLTGQSLRQPRDLWVAIREMKPECEPRERREIG